MVFSPTPELLGHFLLQEDTGWYVPHLLKLVCSPNGTSYTGPKCSGGAFPAASVKVSATASLYWNKQTVYCAYTVGDFDGRDSG